MYTQPLQPGTANSQFRRSRHGKLVLTKTGIRGFIGALSLIAFFAALPWAWIDIAPPAADQVAIRPAVFGATVLALYALISVPVRNLIPNRFVIAFFGLITFFILAAQWHPDPHWSVLRLVAFAIYAVLGFLTAKAYLWLFEIRVISQYLSFISLSFLLSSALAFLIAFGTLTVDSSNTTSGTYIHSVLHGQVFADSESAKGIRHTMAMSIVLFLAFSLHSIGKARLISFFAIACASYLLILPFSRSAWVAAGLIVAAWSVFLLNTFNLRTGVFKVFLWFVFLLVAAGFVAWIVSPAELRGICSLLLDRVLDPRSWEGRIQAGADAWQWESWGTFLVGRGVADSPHNFVLDASLHSGIFGMLGAALIMWYLIRIYLQIFIRKNHAVFFAAIFVVIPIVRMVSAGGGLIYIGDLFALFVALTIYRQSVGFRRCRTALRRAARFTSTVGPAAKP